MYTTQGLPFLEQVPPDLVALPQRLSMRNSCRRCTLLDIGEGRQAAVSETLPAPMEEDASRQYWSYNACCILLLRAQTCLCQSVLLFPWTSPRLRSSLSLLIPLDYAANPLLCWASKTELVFLPLELVVYPHLELARKVNSLWTCSRSVTAAMPDQGSPLPGGAAPWRHSAHAIALLLPPEGCQLVTSPKQAGLTSPEHRAETHAYFYMG